MTKRARLITNPVSRTLPSRDRLAVAPAWLRLHGWTVDVVTSRGGGHTTALARDAAERGYDVVIAAGGDGTINEVVNGIAGTSTALAALPAGTANVWAREAGIPSHPGSVAAMVDRGRRVCVDLGLAGDRYFLLMASLGLDSMVTATISKSAKARFGRNAYVAEGLRAAVRYHGVQAAITVDGTTTTMPLLLALFGNTRSYGGMISISNRASATDGLLDMVLYRAGGLPAFGMHVLRTAAGLHVGPMGADYRQVREALVTTTTPVPVQADGEIIGQTPMRFSIAPKALDVIVPEDALTPSLAASGAG